MEGFAALVLGLGMMAAAQDAAYRAGHPYYYAVPAARAEAAYRPAFVYAPAPNPLPAVGAMTGGLIGAAGAGAPGLVLGAVIGGAMGDAMSVPQVVYVPPPGAALISASASPARSAESTDQFIRRWQAFMEPAPQR